MTSIHQRALRPKIVSIVYAINAAGLDDRDVAAVVNTHLHFDHCGQNHRFGKAPIWITAAEHEISTTEFYTVPEWASIDPDKLRLSNHGETIADGVHLLHTPGHTPGHQSVAVDTEHGLELIIGQACYTCAEYRSASPAITDMHESLLAAGRPRRSRSKPTSQCLCRTCRADSMPMGCRVIGHGGVLSSSCSTARRIHDDSERSSAPAASRIFSRVSGENRTGTSSVSLAVRRRAGHWGPCSARGIAGT